ncbi:MAG TPA: serine/threonine-protein kinase [Pseudomonadota bacterium]|nr:serine/threonine-protein kinase [Pseudomonadota bacterium]
MSRSSRSVPPGPGDGDGPPSKHELGLDVTGKRSDLPRDTDPDPNAKVTLNPDLASATLREPGLAVETPPVSSRPSSDLAATSEQLADESALLRKQMTRSKPTIEELPRGATIGRYMVLSCLGSGGMGVVYAAYDPELDRKVAIKLLKSSSSGSSSRVRFLREAQAMARLSHPNVINVFDVGTIENQVFIAMEFVDGGTLNHWLTDKPRTQREIIDIYTLAGRGLQAAHAAGLVHRDFKPDNVLISREGQVRVMDFGLARSIGQSEDDTTLPRELTSSSSNQALNIRLTHTGAMMGTPRYMAPEQYEGQATDQRTDQFSFCVALYEALYGVPPFVGDDINTLGFNVVRGRVASPPPDTKVPTWIRHVLLRGLQVKPEDRFPSMEELILALNPQTKRLPRPWLVTFVLLSLVLVGNLIYQVREQRRAGMCGGSEEKLRPIWSSQRKSELEQALLSSKQSYAQDVWQRVEQTLDRYASDWSAMRTEACLLTLRGQQTQQILDLRMRCLDDRLAELRALTAILQKADPTVLQEAASATHELSPISGCANIEALSAPIPLPDNPVTRKRVDALRQEMAEVRAIERFGKYSEALVRAEKLAHDSVQSRYKPLAAEAKYLLGEIQMRGGLGAQAEQSLVSAVMAAIDSRHLRVMAESALLLTETTGFRIKQFRKAEVWSQIAEAMLEEISDPEPLRASLYLANCMVASQENHYERAVDQCQKALSLREKLFGHEGPEVAEALNVLAGVYRRSERLAQAIDLYNQALRIETAQLGSLHPNLVSTLRGLGIVARDQLRYDEALSYFQRALSIQEKSLGADNIRVSDYHIQLVRTLLAMNRLDEAEQHAEKAVSIRRKADARVDVERLTEAIYFLGEVKSARGQLHESLKLHEEAMRLREQQRGDRREEMLAFSLTSAGEVLFQLGQAAAARPYLERALNFRETQPADTRRAERSALGRTQFAMAQVLWALGDLEQQKQAIELAQAAAREYEAYGSRPGNILPKITTWLDMHPLPTTRKNHAR